MGGAVTASGSWASTEKTAPAPPRAAPAPARAATAARAAAAPRHPARRGSAQARRTLEVIRGLHRLRAELHVMRPAELLLGEVDLERRRELLAVPLEAADELLVVGTALVPVGEERGGDVHACAVPALRNHVHLLAGHALVGLLGLLGVRDVEVPGLAVHERVHPEPGAVLVDTDVDRQRDLGRIADDGDLLRLPLARGVRLDQPELRGERGGGDRPGVAVLQ